MSVNNQDEAVDSNMKAILSEIKLIDDHHKERQIIYQQCLTKYLNHLNLQTQQLLNSQKQIQKRNSNISLSFQTVYDSIFEGADRALRSVRRTYQAKHSFWAQTIKEARDLNDLQLKKQLYSLMRDTQQRYQDAIEARRNNKKTDFKRVFTKKQADKTLINFQQTNNAFEGKVYLGTNTTSKWKPLQNTYFNNANKQNQIHNVKTPIQNTRNKQYNLQLDSILNNFVKK